MRYVLRLSVVASAVFLYGCGENTNDARDASVEQAIESQPAARGEDVEVDLDTPAGRLRMESGEQSVELDTTTGSGHVVTESGWFSFGEGTQLPEEFPADVPMYPGMQVLGVNVSEESATIVVQATANDAIDEVAAFFAKETSAEGWAEESSTVVAEVVRQTAYTKDDRTLNITLSPGMNAGGPITMVAVTVSKQ